MKRLSTVFLLLLVAGCATRPDTPSTDTGRGLRTIAALDLALESEDLGTVLIELDSLASRSTQLRHPTPDSIALVRAKVALRQGRYDDVVALTMLADRPRGELSDDLLSTFALLTGRALTRVGDYSSAQTAIRDALSIRQRLFGATDLRTAEAFHYFGLAYHEEGNHDGALQQYAEALRVRQLLAPEGKSTAATLNNIANIYWRRGAFERALELHQEALRIKSFFATPSDLGVTHANLANLYSEMGQPERSDHHFETALTLYSSGQPNPLFVAKAQNDFGSHLWETGRPLRARVNWEEARLRYNHILGSEHSSVGIVEINLAKSLVVAGDLSQGHDLYLEGIRKVQAASRPAAIEGKAQFAEVVSLAGRQELANQILGEAIELESERSGGFGHRHLALERDRARFLHRENRLRAARTVLEQAIIANAGSLADGGVNRLRRNVLSIEELLAAFTAWADVILETLERDQIHWTEAERILSTFESAIAHFLSSKAIPMADGHTARYRREFHSVLDAAYRFAFEFDSHFSSVDSSQRLYRISEIRHATDLREALAHDKAVEVANIPAALVAQEREFRTELRALQRQAAISVEDELTTSRLERAARAFALEDSLSRLLEMYKVGFPAYHRLRYAGSHASLGEVQRRAGDEACLLVYHVVHDRVSALAVKAGHFSSVNLGEYPQLRSDVSSYLMSVQQDLGGFSRQLASGLYERLVAPVQVLEGCHDWIIVPDDVLADLPFESLVANREEEDSSAKYLIEDKTISYANSATAFADGYNMDKVHAQDGLFAAAPVFVGGVEISSHMLGRPAGEPARVFGELRGSGREVVAISRLFGRLESASKATVLLSEQATEGQIKSASLKDYRFIHLATHGIAVESQPTLSALLLQPGENEDGLLQVGEILNLQLAAEMVVLSACETGKPESSRGRGLAGLTGAFLYAGTSTVVASLWNSDDAYTAATMAHFYNNILSGQSKAEALRQAKLKLMEDPEVRARPGLWAPFILIGQS